MKTKCSNYFIIFSSQAVDKSVMNSMSDARDAIVNVCLDSLTAYKATLPTGQTMGGSLMCPHSLRLLPAYMLALLKNVSVDTFVCGLAARLFCLQNRPWAVL